MGAGVNPLTDAIIATGDAGYRAPITFCTLVPLLIFKTIDRLMDAARRIWIDLSFVLLMAKTAF